MIWIDPLKVALWTFRRSERDVVNLYNSLSPVMQLATGGSMLNFGYWSGGSQGPVEAQRDICSLVAGIAELASAKKLVDVGSGLAAPAAQWKSAHGHVDISCVNINYRQLIASKSVSRNTVSLVNATSASLPFGDRSADRVIALESAQHFRPLPGFVRESRRILKPGGLLVMAIPVTTIPARSFGATLKLGILSFTWSSEHYGLEYVKSAIEGNGFEILDSRFIGRQVYEPLADYYALNRKSLRQKILQEYPSFLENVLYKSLLKMRDISAKGIINYVVIKAS